MKVYVQVVDTLSGLSQNGMIEEEIQKGSEIQNALKHFGIIYGEVSWIFNKKNIYVGEIDDTFKIVNIITI